MKKIKKEISIQDKVYNFKTKHKIGFVKSEIKKLLNDYPGIDMKKFNKALEYITMSAIDGETVIYHVDIEKAIRCGVEKRDLKSHEWD